MFDCAIQLHVAAIHAEAGYNGETPGAGILCGDGGDWRVAAGTYFNSIRKQSIYLGAAYQPFKVGPVRAGWFLGAVDGYRPAPMPMAAGVVSFDVTEKIGVHVIGIPAVKGVTPATAELSVSYKF